MKEVSPKEMRKHCNKSLKRVKRGFRKRMREIAKDGYNYGKMKVGEFAQEDAIIAWLEGLGFTISRDDKEIKFYW